MRELINDVCRAAVVAVCALLAMVAISSVVRCDESTYWRARVNAALAVQQATDPNPWYPSTPPIKPEKPATAKVDNRPVVYRMTAVWCAPCAAVDKQLTSEVRAKLPFQIVDWDVDAKGWMGSPTIPAFWWESPKGKLRCQWTTIEALVSTWKHSQTVKAVAKR